MIKSSNAITEVMKLTQWLQKGSSGNQEKIEKKQAEASRENIRFQSSVAKGEEDEIIFHGL